MRLPWFAPILACSAIVAAAGCYTGTFRVAGDAFIGQRVRFADCIDLSVAQTTDDVAPGTVLAYTFGNRCSHLAVVDLSAIHAVGRYGDGVRPMHALDPKHELRPMRLELWHSAIEQIAYVSDDESAPTAICVDVGAVEVAAEPTARWLCFGAWDLGDTLAAHDDAGASADARVSSLTRPAAIETRWPLPAEPEPEVIAMPADVQDGIASVGAYLAGRIADKRRLVKALHDYVVLHVRYEQAGPPETRASQQADDVFARKTGVCEGYARLLTALGTAAGVDIRYIGGEATGADFASASPGAHPHAWNAANLDGEWALIDATWDVDRDSTLSTKYLMMPPGRFARDHRPDDPSWTLLSEPLSLDDFLRAPFPRSPARTAGTR